MHRLRGFIVATFVVAAASFALPTAGGAQDQGALAELDAVIAEIRERYLGEAPRPTVGPVQCSESSAELVQRYIALHARFVEADEAVKEAAAVERRANELVQNGDFCARGIVNDQMRAIEWLGEIELDSVLTNAQEIAECALSLQQTAERRMPTLRNAALMTATQQEVDTMRDMRGSALQMAAQTAFARDLRVRVVQVMEDNLSICR